MYKINLQFQQQYFDTVYVIPGRSSIYDGILYNITVKSDTVNITTILNKLDLDNFGYFEQWLN